MIIDTHTGKVIVTNEELCKKAKEWLASKSNEEWIKLIEEKIKKDSEKYMDKKILEAITSITGILEQIIRNTRQSFDYEAMEKVQKEYNKLIKIMKAGEGNDNQKSD